MPETGFAMLDVNMRIMGQARRVHPTSSLILRRAVIRGLRNEPINLHKYHEVSTCSP